MKISHALITAAGQAQRHIPLQTIVERSGFPRTVLSHLVEEALSSGIEKVGVVISPQDAVLYERAAGDLRERIVFLEQKQPLGYGHAIACGKEFIGENPFLLMVSDHLYISRDSTRSCARQLVEIATAERCCVSAVQSTHESSLSSFGAVGGTLFDSRPGIYAVDHVLEKPTPTQAEQELSVPGMRQGRYLCFFGMHVITPPVLNLLHERLAATADPRSVHLVDILDSLGGVERYLAAELAGRRFDLEQRYGLLVAQLALALDSPQREEMLASLVSLLADAS
jgi:UTP--glucose-1-phosphate uridylyltransferase